MEARGIGILDAFLVNLASFVLGSAISAVVLGFMLDKFVIKKITANKDVQDIIKLIRDVKNELMEHNGKKEG